MLDHVFSDINKSQRFKIFAGHNQVHNEVIWFYPSASSTEIDRYVTYNYAEKFGLLELPQMVIQELHGIQHLCLTFH